MRERKTLIIIWMLVFTAGLALAQDVRVSISSREGYVGLPLDYQITVRGTRKVERPELTGFDGFDVRFTKNESYNINGELTVKFSWELIPLREGDLTIPSVTVDVEGQSYSTPRGTVTISPPRKMEGFKLILHPEEDKVYMEQSVTVDMDFYVSSEVGGLKFTLPGNGAGSREGEDFLILESLPPDQNSHDVRQIPVGDRIFYGYVSSRFEGGAQYTVLTIPLEIMPLRAGPISLEGATVSFSTQQVSWGGIDSDSYVIPSDPCELAAARLPGEIENSPNGILLSRGDLRAEAVLSSDKARPGDPLTLQVILSGLAHPELCEIPDLEDFTDLGDEFSLPADRSRPKAEGDKLTITQTIRPVSVETRGVPSLEFLYFDLDEEKVKRVSTEFIPLAMSSAGDLSLSDVENFLGEADTPRLQENDRGIRQNKSLDDLMAGDRRGTTLWESPVFIIFLIFPPGLFLLYLIYSLFNIMLKRRRERAGNNALLQLRNSLNGGEDSFAAFDWYLRSRLFHGKSFHRRDLKEKASSLDMADLIELYEGLERSRYGGGGDDVSPDALLMAARELEKKL